ncbi:MAG TPA: hypothetical protein PKD54_03805 [Pirellulaceae bacterium]|nr:hypothetical protein [Pirellulaceae bacterium]
MDKKAKKRLEVINKKLDSLRRQLSGAKQQLDDPDEVTKLEADIAALNREAEELKQR